MSVQRTSRRHGATAMSRWVGLTLVVAAMAGETVQAWALNNPGVPWDDAYITFAYSRSFAAGHFFQLTSASPRVEGFSSLLWMLVLAGAGWLGLAIPNAAQFLGVLAGAALVPATAALARRIRPEMPWLVALAAGCFVGLVPATAYHALSGMETVPFALLVVLAVLQLLRELHGRGLAWGSAALFAAVATTRPEGALPLLAAVVSVAAFVDSPRRRRWAVVVGGWLIVLVVGREALFHQLLPNTVRVKSTLSLAATLHGDAGQLGKFVHQYWPVILLAAFAVGAAWRVGRFAVRFPVLVTLSLAAVEIFAAAGDGYPLQRYLYPLVPLIAALAAVGAYELVQGLRRRGRGRVMLIAGAAVTLVGLPGVASVAQEPVASMGARTAPNAAPGVYLNQVAQLLARHTTSRSLVALDEIGKVAFLTNAQVLDLYGLADAHLAARPGLPGDKVDLAYVYGQRPDFFAFPTAKCFCIAGGPDDSAYAAAPQFLAYQLAGEFPFGSPTPREFLFERRPGVLSSVSLAGAVPAGELVPRHPFELAPRLRAQLAQTIMASAPAPSASSVAAGAILFPGTIYGIDGPPGGASSEADLPVEVPANPSQFVVTVAPPAGGGSWQVSVRDSGGHQTLAATLNVPASSPGPAAVDLSAPLARWAGEQVTVMLRYTPSDATAPFPSGWPAWMQPRLLER